MFRLVFTISFLLCGTLARADYIPPAEAVGAFALPDTNQNYTGPVDFYSFGVHTQQVNTNVGGMVYASTSQSFTSANGSNDSFTGATVSTGGLFTKNTQAYAYSGVVYFLEVQGPTGGKVPLNVLASGNVSTADSVPDYLLDSFFAVFDGSSQTTSSGEFINPPVITADACAANGFYLGGFYSQDHNCSTARNSSFSLSGQYLFDTDTLYQVEIDSVVDVVPSTNVLGTTLLTNGVQLDPSFSLDPVYAATGLYTLETSPSASPAVADTPEPNTFLLTVTGAAIWFLLASAKAVRSKTKRLVASY